MGFACSGINEAASLGSLASADLISMRNMQQVRVVRLRPRGWRAVDAQVFAAMQSLVDEFRCKPAAWKSRMGVGAN